MSMVRPRDIPYAHYWRCSNREQAIALGSKAGGYILNRIDEHSGVHHSRVSRIVAINQEVEGR